MTSNRLTMQGYKLGITKQFISYKLGIKNARSTADTNYKLAIMTTSCNEIAHYASKVLSICCTKKSTLFCKNAALFCSVTYHK